MSLYNDTTVRLKWGAMPDKICANLPYPIELTAHACVDKDVDGHADKEEPTPLNVGVRVCPIRSVVALDENFADCELGKWKVTCETHYEYGFDVDVSATGNPSMFLKGGNDSNFGMVMTVMRENSSAFEDDQEVGQATELERFQPARVTFYVRTDSPDSDAGHFILGESNEVNRRVAQFQFTKDGNMGLLGSGGTSYGAVPYEPFTWYRIDLTFQWERKEVDFYVNCKLEECAIPFRRTASSYIGACALGNRDRCTTWFDSFRFITEEELPSNKLSMIDGRLSAWCEPIGREEEFWLQAVVETDRNSHGGRASGDGSHAGASGAFVRWGPFTPMPGREVAQRLALNQEALVQISSLLDDEASADVTFVVGDERIHAHSNILKARCETLRAMLCSQMAEGQCSDARQRSDTHSGGSGSEGGSGAIAKRIVNVREVRPAVFRKMLEHLYGGAMDVDADMAIELLALADQYMLPGLKLTCGFALRRSITVETVCRIIQAADRFDCQGSELKAQCLSFIMHNYQAVVGSSMWDELEASPHLLVQITREIATSGRGDLLASTRADTPPAHNTRKRARESV
mmetsp:Transcript_10653/g.27658  ORF Transcript_10653/g.27658 Transcript_10653/m.27658 type:complete len:575 (+) Transcript_10653:126-1850(+)|eukprot:CAMPEP_0119418628 /NCGR_PEP_ID=MMETSP1335-20130426/18727_1 /TAXON_ID=259385 /ORGANISM="Chrysoculter rhomboideus, Strain RCC1486" /LENGTH=574 /DNA_ID=CAMNT_0007443885 /DNA_START=54 /DNA_END=1778 /DNA_ORIENTATION=+